MSNLPALTDSTYTKEAMKEANGAGYLPNSIRTYTIPPLSNNPTTDAEIHLAAPAKGQKGHSLVRTNIGTFFGCLSVETGRAAPKAIFKYPSAKDIKSGDKVGKTTLTKVKTRQLKTLYPTFILERYGLDFIPDDFTALSSTPIYLDTKGVEFVAFLDDLFLDGIDPSVVTSGTKQTRVYYDKDQKPKLAFYAKNFEDFTSKDSIYHSDFTIVQQNYETLMVASQNLEKVIVVNYASQGGSVDDATFGMVNGSLDEKIFFESKLDWSFYIGARYKKSVYPYDKEGNLVTTKRLIVSRDHASDINLIRQMDKTKGGVHKCTILLPYSDSDFEMLTNLRKKIDEINDVLGGLFSHSKNEEKQATIDKPLSEALNLLTTEQKLMIDCKANNE
ncbi:hypothetical protein [Vibrio owensii]|uniref:hypothetical protein n=1 Tax=Vibrio harveyi group TaxID=717610 RepID=UPI003CC61E68